MSTCGGCKWVHAQRGESTPCSTCEEKALPQNEEALMIYALTRWQTIETKLGEKRVVDISIEAVESAMTIFGVRDKKSCLLKVNKLFHYFIGSEL